jgi:hypothetical protein
MIGLRISDSGPNENEVYLNTYNNLTVGQLFSDINANVANPARQGLQTLCNSFTNNSEYDVCINSYPPPIFFPSKYHYVRKYQGTQLLPTGNLFYGSSMPVINIMNSNINNNISYYYGVGGNEYPRAVTNVTTFPAGIVVTEGCLSHYGQKIAKSLVSDLAQYDQWNAEYEYWLTQWYVGCGEQDAVSGEETDIIHEILRFAQNDASNTLTVLPSSGLTVSEDITLLPNPTTGELHVTCHASLVSSIEIFDVYGRKLLSHTTHHTPHTALDISHLPAGFYFVKIKTDDKEVVKKVVKQ